jgi:hypothetical protein
LRPRPTRAALVAGVFVAAVFVGLVGGTADSRLRPGGVTDRTRPRLAEGPRRPTDGTRPENSRRSPGSIIRRVSSSGMMPRAARLSGVLCRTASQVTQDAINMTAAVLPTIPNTKKSNSSQVSSKAPTRPRRSRPSPKLRSLPVHMTPVRVTKRRAAGQRLHPVQDPIDDSAGNLALRTEATSSSAGS